MCCIPRCPYPHRPANILQTICAACCATRCGLRRRDILPTTPLAVPLQSQHPARSAMHSLPHKFVLHIAAGDILPTTPLEMVLAMLFMLCGLHVVLTLHCNPHLFQHCATLSHPAPHVVTGDILPTTPLEVLLAMLYMLCALHRVDVNFSPALQFPSVLWSV